MLEETARRILTVVHSQGVNRIDGPLKNIDAYAAAFDIKPCDKMYVAPDQRIRIR